MKRGQRVFVHIGGMKTGTSFLQQILQHNVDALHQDGAAFAGRRGWRDQVNAVRDVLQMSGSNAPERDTSGTWQQLVDDMGRSEAAQIISMEFLSFTGPERAAHVVESLAPAEVHVVLSVRDAGRVIPAQWQEHTQNRGRQSWREWCEALADTAAGPSTPKGLLQALRVPRMVRSWSPTVPAGRFHVVTVPPSGSPADELWRRFAEALSLSAERYRLPTRRANESLGHVSAELMRRLNERVRDLQVRDYNHVVKAQLGKRILTARSDEPKVVLPAMLAEAAAGWDRRSIRAIRASSAHVIGDLGDLALRTPTAPELLEVGDEMLLEALGDAHQGLLSIAVQQGVDTRSVHAAASRRSASTGDALARAFDELEQTVRTLAAAGRKP